jgi:hypothetical protein
MIKISSACDATWRRLASATWLKLAYLHSSHGPDHQLQRRQRVYQQLGVQQALVLVQINRNSET